MNADTAYARVNLVTAGSFGELDAPTVDRHNNFGNPDANISNATAGVITTADDGRAAQFGLRLAW
jgi:hypothetical protein